MSFRRGDSMTKRLTLLSAILVAAACAIAALDGLSVSAYLERFTEMVRAAGNWGPAVVVAIYALATILFIPGGLLTLLAGFLFGVVKGTITISVASVVGAAAAFCLGRTVAHDWAQRRFAQSNSFRAINSAVNRQSLTVVLFVRLSPVFPFVFTNYAFSVTKIRFRDFIFASWIGMLPATVLYVYLGSLARNLAELTRGDADEWGLRVLLPVIGLLATAAVVYVLIRGAKSAMNGKEMAGCQLSLSDRL